MSLFKMFSLLSITLGFSFCSGSDNNNQTPKKIDTKVLISPDDAGPVDDSGDAGEFLNEAGKPSKTDANQQKEEAGAKYKEFGVFVEAGGQTDAKSSQDVGIKTGLNCLERFNCEGKCAKVLSCILDCKSKTCSSVGSLIDSLLACRLKSCQSLCNSSLEGYEGEECVNCLSNQCSTEYTSCKNNKC